ncbi:MAG: efflux RND transporter permease subunit [Butyricimonas paravirosa]
MFAFCRRLPQYMVDVDAAKCEQAGVTPAEVLATLADYYGGGYISNFNRFSKLYRVMIQASPEYRVTPESLDRIYVRVGEDMAPLSQFVTLTKTYGPQGLDRFNLYNSITLNGSAAIDYSSGDALHAIERQPRNSFEEIMVTNLGAYRGKKAARRTIQSSFSLFALYWYILY